MNRKLLVSLAVGVVVIVLLFMMFSGGEDVPEATPEEIKKLMQPEEVPSTLDPTLAPPKSATSGPVTQTNTESTTEASAASTAEKSQNTNDFGKEPNNGLSNYELIALYGNQIIKNPKDGNAYYQRALVYQKMGHYSAAISDYGRALDISPESANALFNRGLCLEKRLEHVKAIADFTKALKIKKDDPRIYNARGLAHAENNDPAAAQADYMQAIALDPSYEQAYFNLGTVYERQKKYKESIEQYNKAIEHNKPDDDPTNDLAETARKMEAYYRRAIVYLNMNDITNALKDATYVIDNDPKNSKAFRLRAAIYSKAGNSAAAASDEVAAQNLGLEGMLRSNDTNETEPAAPAQSAPAAPTPAAATPATQ